MQQWIGDKLCEFGVDDQGQATVHITFPNARIFKPQKDGSMKVYTGKRRVMHTAETLAKLIDSVKNPGQLPTISKMLGLFATTNAHGAMQVKATQFVQDNTAQRA